MCVAVQQIANVVDIEAESIDVGDDLRRALGEGAVDEDMALARGDQEGAHALHPDIMDVADQRERLDRPIPFEIGAGERRLLGGDDLLLARERRRLRGRRIVGRCSAGGEKRKRGIDRGAHPHSAASACARPRSTLTSCEMPCSGMVTP
jgi:hypothetical protein